MTVIVACPTCKKSVHWDDAHPFKPFCSEKCKLIDLGDWAEERNSIPVKSEFPDEFNLNE